MPRHRCASSPTRGEVTRVRACADSFFKRRNRCRHTSAFPRHEIARVVHVGSAPKRAWGMPGAQCTRSLVCEVGSSRCTRVFTAVAPEITRHPRTQWFYGLLRALPGETWLVCHRHPRDAKHHRELDTSHWGIRTTRLHRPRQPRSSVAAIASIAPRAQRP